MNRMKMNQQENINVIDVPSQENLNAMRNQKNMLAETQEGNIENTAIAV